MATTLPIAQILYTQGFGTRRDCAGLLARGDVAVAGRPITDPAETFDTAGLVVQVQGRDWPYHARALVLLHKPAGYECSTRPKHHPSVLMLLPPPLRTRGVQPVGRLDEDTTGALLLTDDGPLIHRLTSPKRHVPKLYEVTTKHPVDPAQVQRLRDGVVLHEDERRAGRSAPPETVRAADCEAVGERTLRMTLTEGRYHQVKRMVAAAGNRVEALHRVAFGALALPPALAPGQWCWVDEAQVLGSPGARP